MPAVHAHIRITPDGTLTGRVPVGTPAGEHEATILIIPSTPATPKTFRLADLPVHDTPWDDSVSLRREDLYGDDGR